MANCLKAAKQEYRKSNLHKIVLGNHIKETKFQEINKNKTIQICKSSFGRFQYVVSPNKCKLFFSPKSNDISNSIRSYRDKYFAKHISQGKKNIKEGGGNARNAQYKPLRSYAKINSL